MINRKSKKLAVIGLGYVGLPLAVEFGKKYNTFGFDINKSRIEELTAGNDSTLEVTSEEISSSKNLNVQYNLIKYFSLYKLLICSNVYSVGLIIIALPVQSSVSINFAANALYMFSNCSEMLLKYEL